MGAAIIVSETFRYPPLSYSCVPGHRLYKSILDKELICVQLQFQKQEVPCLRNQVSRLQTLEQTQEVTVAQGREGGEILGAWGQVLLRSKERQGDRLLITGGIQAWVLLAGQEGQQPECLDAWIPFRLDWDLPEDTAEGTDRVLPVLSSVDARWTGAGKLLIRAGISALAECWQKTSVSVPGPVGVPEDVALQQQRWPVWLPREAGEKAFSLEEALTLPSSAPAVEKILYCRMDPAVTDHRVLGSKVVFRGNGNLHLAYLCPEGRVRSWDHELPFSQYAELQGDYSPDARVHVVPAVTALELNPNQDGTWMLHGGLTGQYLVEDRQLVETVADAFSPRRQVVPERQELPLPVVLDSRRETLTEEQELPVGSGEVADTTVLTDLPRFTRSGEGALLEVPHRTQVLYYDEEGQLRGATHRWTRSMDLEAGPGTALTAFPGPAMTRQRPGMEGTVLQLELPLLLRTMEGEGICAVTGLALGEPEEPDPDRPSLVLRRAGSDTLWDLARQSGSTVAAIMGANGLEGEPDPDRMLLIPVV